MNITAIQHKFCIGDTIKIGDKSWIVAEICPVVRYNGIEVKYFVERGKMTKMVREA